MHELGIMYHIVEQVLRVVETNQLSEVEAIVLQVGELSSVVPRYLHACFPAAVDGTVLENTKLEVEILTANGICGDCGKVYPLLEHAKVCPECKGEAFEIISGREFYLKEIRAC
ncbi:hydrogenase maturation nickel metallochaperone HypA/HybF [Konateibacter massiliensis]|uniref:hydrogenase maturation nickel metallochaperone HypA/HybF n=1 Tax=Konateibacter massiliensis TaxID=2002841 RepID=UPI000C147F07|nr:hydrogenase maturation nickel metallochaperone HypA [Konateibacter massiliensis]